MAEAQLIPPRLSDPGERLAALQRIAERSRRVAELWLTTNAKGGRPGSSAPTALAQDFLETATRLMARSDQLVQAHAKLWQDYLALWHASARRLLGQQADPMVEPTRDDRRFKGEGWQDPVFDLIKQGYLLSARCLQTTLKGIEGLDERKRKRLDFYTRQFVDAFSPTNFALTNPEVLKATAASGGENLIRGFENLLDDLERGRGQLSIKTTDSDAFELGRNVAATPGKVVFQNDLMQLIQYAPTTEQVHKRPTLTRNPRLHLAAGELPEPSSPFRPPRALVLRGALEPCVSL